MPLMNMSRGCLKDISRSDGNLSHIPSVTVPDKKKIVLILIVFLQVNMLVIELKSEALKDRHWKQLMKRLHVNWVPSELTLGQIWDVDLQKNEMVVKDVLLVAQGEMALEEFLKQVNNITPLQILKKCMWCIFQQQLLVFRSVRCGTRMSSI